MKDWFYAKKQQWTDDNLRLSGSEVSKQRRDVVSELGSVRHPQQRQHLYLEVLTHTAHLRLGQRRRQIHCISIIIISTDSIARSAKHWHISYSEANFEVYRHTGATSCTDGGEIWYGGVDHSVHNSMPRLLHAKFHPIGAMIRVSSVSTSYNTTKNSSKTGHYCTLFIP